MHFFDLFIGLEPPFAKPLITAGTGRWSLVLLLLLLLLLLLSVIAKLCMLCVYFSFDAKFVQQICQSALHDFNLCMFRQDSDQRTASAVAGSTEDRPSHLSNEMVFKIIVICLAMIHVMQKDGQFRFVGSHSVTRLLEWTSCCNTLTLKSVNCGSLRYENHWT